MDLKLSQWNTRGQWSLMWTDLWWINNDIKNALRRVSDARGFDAPYYADRLAEIGRRVDDAQTIESFVRHGLPDDLSSMLDHPLMLAFTGYGMKDGATTALSRVHAEDLTTANTIPGLERSRETSPVTHVGAYGPAGVLSFADLAGVSSDLRTVPDQLFCDVFSAAHDSWLSSPHDGDLSVTDYVIALVRAGEFDYHTYHEPWRDVVTEILDITIVWPLYKAVSGYDPITLSALPPELRGLEALSGLIDLASLLAAIPTAGASLTGLAAVEYAGKVLAGEYIKSLALGVLSTGASLITSEVARELGLPSWVETTIAMGASVTVGIVAGKYVAQIWDSTGVQLGRDIPVPIDPHGPTLHTVAQSKAPQPYSGADVEQALKSAPHANGDPTRPLDWRTGEPLRLTDAQGHRGWYMAWDPDHARWVAQNRGGVAQNPGGVAQDPGGLGAPANEDDDDAYAMFMGAIRWAAGMATNPDGSTLAYEAGDVVMADENGYWYKVVFPGG